MNDYDDIMRRLPPALRARAQDHGNYVLINAAEHTIQTLASMLGIPKYEVHGGYMKNGKRYWIYVNPNRSTTHAADDSRICS